MSAVHKGIEAAQQWLDHAKDLHPDVAGIKARLDKAAETGDHKEALRAVQGAFYKTDKNAPHYEALRQARGHLLASSPTPSFRRAYEVEHGRETVADPPRLSSQMQTGAKGGQFYTTATGRKIYKSS